MGRAATSLAWAAALAVVTCMAIVTSTTDSAAGAASVHLCTVEPTGAVTAVAVELPRGNVTGTTTADLQSFANAYNTIAAAHCLPQIPAENFRAAPCLLERLTWISGDPDPDILSAWGHNGTRRSDGEPTRGCDGNLAGGSGYTGATAATKWWASKPHRASLYLHTDTCINFAMTRGGAPADSPKLARAAARTGPC